MTEKNRVVKILPGNVQKWKPEINKIVQTINIHEGLRLKTNEFILYG